MNKKAIGIAAAVVIVIIAIIAVVFMLKGKGTQEPEIDTSTMAGELNPYIPNMTEEDIKNTLDKPTTEEQENAFNEAISMIEIPEIGSDITVDEEGTAHYTDKDGFDIEIEVNQEIKDKTDEELEDDYEQMMAELQAIKDRNGGGTTSNNTSGNSNNNIGNNNNGNTSTGSNNTSNNNQSSEVSDEVIQAQIEAALKQQQEAINNGATFGSGDLTNEDIEEIGNQLVPTN